MFTLAKGELPFLKHAMRHSAHRTKSVFAWGRLLEIKRLVDGYGNILLNHLTVGECFLDRSQPNVNVNVKDWTVMVHRRKPEDDDDESSDDGEIYSHEEGQVLIPIRSLVRRGALKMLSSGTACLPCRVDESLVVHVAQ